MEETNLFVSKSHQWHLLVKPLYCMCVHCWSLHIVFNKDHHVILSFDINARFLKFNFACLRGKCILICAAPSGHDRNHNISLLNLYKDVCASSPSWVDDSCSWRCFTSCGESLRSHVGQHLDYSWQISMIKISVWSLHYGNEISLFHFYWSLYFRNAAACICVVVPHCRHERAVKVVTNCCVSS